MTKPISDVGKIMMMIEGKIGASTPTRKFWNTCYFVSAYIFLFVGAAVAASHPGIGMIGPFSTIVENLLWLVLLASLFCLVRAMMRLSDPYC